MKNNFIFLIVVSTIICTVWSVVESQDCSKTEDLMKCINQMRILTDDKEFEFILTKEELDKVCSELNRGMRCIDSYTLRCLSEENRNHFNQMYQGTKKVFEKLCEDGPYQEEYLEHAPCMKQVKAGAEECAQKYQEKIGEVSARLNDHTKSTNESVEERAVREGELQTLCCSFRDYLVCSKTIVMDKCGEKTANFTEDFLNQMSNTLVQAFCKNFPHGSDDCGTSAAVRTAYSSWKLHLLLNLSLAISYYFHHCT